LKDRSHIWLPALLMLVFAATRWPGLMPENFSAAYALAFCAGVYFPRPWRWILPMATLALTDLALNAYYGAELVNLYLLATLGGFALIIGLGTLFKPRSSMAGLLGGGLLGSVIFYLVSNAAAWLYDPGYPKTLAGLVQALTTGLPGFPHTWEFFRNTLLSGGLFTGLFCGAMNLSAAKESQPEDESEEEEPQAEAAPAAEPAAGDSRA